MLRNPDRALEALAARRVTPAWLPLLWRYLGLRPAAYPFEVPLVSEGRISLPGLEELTVFWQVFVRRCYHVPPDCKVIIDAGGNIGVFSVWASREAPSAKIIALEPIPSTLQTLEKNMSANRLEDRVRVLPAGLAANTCQREFMLGAPSPNRRMVLDAASSTHDQAGLWIQCLCLADLFEQELLGEVDLLKMDIEGAEWEVLLSAPPAVLKKIRRLELEYHEVHRRFGYTPEKLFAHLELAGLKLIRREEDRFHTGLASFCRI